MQYREGKRVNIKQNNTKLVSSLIKGLIAEDKKKDVNKRPIYATPVFWIIVSWLIVNSLLSLLKVIFELRFTSINAQGSVNQNITPPSGCIIACPSDRPVKNIMKNIKFQKLSLLSLAIIKSRILLSRLLSIYYLYYIISYKRLLGFRAFFVKNRLFILENYIIITIFSIY